MRILLTCNWYNYGGQVVLKKASMPVYVVSNIDRNDIEIAINYHKFKIAGLITSEDCRSYKPRKEVFQKALVKFGLSSKEVIHVGDSYSSDVEGGSNADIDTVWLNRKRRPLPEKRPTRLCQIIAKLTELTEKKII